MEEISVLERVIQFITDYRVYISSVLAVLGALGSSAIFAFLRRPKSSTKEIGQHLTDKTLLSPPTTRPAYSDRMAYVLSEMSDLAYYKFEGLKDFISDTAQNALALNLTTAVNIQTFLEEFSTGLMSRRNPSLIFLKKILSNSGFALLDVIDVAETQAFVCKRVAKDEPSYIVLAFRGTEKNISDWLTDARAFPTIGDGGTRVHSGFLEAFDKNINEDGKTVKELVKEILNRQEAKDTYGNSLPLFITGHSLGGALALLATKLVAPNVNGACYTFGAPRVANYEYFRRIKTPVYRVVNSSDIVPRVPPGAGMQVFVGVVKTVSWLTSFMPVVSSLFDKLESKLDKLKGYRHFGDLRYLTDVAEGRFNDVRLLPNPPAIDRIIWMGSHITKLSFFMPIKSHSMAIYRKKLRHVANDRNKKLS